MTIEELKQFTEDYFNVSLEPVDRKAHNVRARFIFYKTAYSMYPSKTLQEIGNVLGQNHATVLHGIREVSNIIKFETTSFIRGRTFDRAIIIVDEMQNLNFHELDSVMTRAGENTRLILCGDYLQSDFNNDGERNGLAKFLNIIERMKDFSVIQFGWDDIVRSGIVRDYIMTKELMGMR